MGSAGNFHESELLGMPCYAGLDLAATADITAFTMVFPWEDGTIRYSEDVGKRRAGKRSTRPHRCQLRRFCSFWALDSNGGNVTDYNVVENDILELCRHRLKV